jgi:hypothetical protein
MGCCNIAITLIDLKKGETKAQACANALGSATSIGHACCIILPAMQTSPTDTLRGVGMVLLLALLVLAFKAIWQSPRKLRTGLHIFLGMALGAVVGLAIAFPTRNVEFSSHLGEELCYCGGIFVAVHKIRHPTNPGSTD